MGKNISSYFCLKDESLFAFAFSDIQIFFHISVEVFLPKYITRIKDRCILYYSTNLKDNSNVYY